MYTVFKNLTDTTLVISDINIKFERKGKKGDTLDLAKLVSQDAIAKSVDLKNVLLKQMLAPLNRGPVPASQKITVQQRIQAQQAQRKYYIAPKSQPKIADPNCGKMVVAYDPNKKEMVSPTNRKTNPIPPTTATTINFDQERKIALQEQRKHESATKETVQQNFIVYTPPEKEKDVLDYWTPEQMSGALPVPMPTPSIEPDVLCTENLVEVDGATCNENACPDDVVLDNSVDDESITEEAQLEILGQQIVKDTETKPLNSKNCSHVKHDGKQCRRKKQANSEYCHFHNPTV